MKNKNNKGGLLNATQQKLISNMTKKFMGSDVKLRLLPNNGIMINGLEFTVIGESIGRESSKGFAISITGDEIDKDRLKFTTITMKAGSGAKNTAITKRLTRALKSDGKYAYQAKFPNTFIPEAEDLSGMDKLEQLMAGSRNQFVFKLTPYYEGEKETEVMIAFYPYESVLTGAATLYKKVTSNSNYYADSLKK
ncbi:hypothetical protein [Ruminococcus sp. NK3A76]|uniref:hypothetical protein n=1 Tax=Ruminococcus sp. NK3A76 TaxID=877411 RepID=UPI00048F86B2|nr:hypothetical protein [Ruminococcus sp. NK3A76]